MANDTPASLPDQTAVLLWGTTIGLIVLGLSAPVRAWGWQGGTALALAFMLGVLAIRHTPGSPPRRLFLSILGVAMVLPFVFRVLLPVLRGEAGG